MASRKTFSFRIALLGLTFIFILIVAWGEVSKFRSKTIRDQVIHDLAAEGLDLECRDMPDGDFELIAVRYVPQDFDLKRLAPFTEIRILTFRHLDDSQAENLRQFPGLEILRAKSSSITNRGLTLISAIGNLSHLRLSMNRNEVDYTPLGKLAGLDELYVTRTSFDDRALRSVASLSLSTLVISGTRVSSNGLISLGEKQLDFIELVDLELDDSALRYLFQLKNPKCIDIRSNDFSIQSIEKLKRRFPDTLILSLHSGAQSVDHAG